MGPQKFLATDEGLEFAEGVARQLGMEFDRDATRREADEMHDLYFNAIVRVTGLPVSLVAFHAAALRKVNAYVPFSETEQGEVFFDEQLDAWLLAMSQLITIMACKPIEANEVGALVSAFVKNLDVAIEPHLHESIRTRLKGFICRHPDCMPLAVPLRRAMVVFVICHEIGHIVAGHHNLSEGPSRPIEWEADRIAADLYRQVVVAGLEAHPVSIHPKLAGAPILMMYCFDLIQKRRIQRGEAAKRKSSHPSGSERTASLLRSLEPVLDEAGYVLDGFTAAIKELTVFADLN
jgi:hypothetical protein